MAKNENLPEKGTSHSKGNFYSRRAANLAPANMKKLSTAAEMADADQKICDLHYPRARRSRGTFWNYSSCNDHGCQKEFIAQRNRIDLSSFLSPQIFLPLWNDAHGRTGGMYVCARIIKYLYSGSPLTPAPSPKDPGAAFFAVTFSTQQVIGYAHIHQRII